MMQIFLNPYKTLHTKSTPFDFSNDSIMHYQDLEKFEYDFANFMNNSKTCYNVESVDSSRKQRNDSGH